MEEIPHQGRIKLGYHVKMGYFAQNQAQLLNENLTVFETIDEIATGEVRTKIRDILGAFLFSGEDTDKKVKVLSGGEKSRLAMIRLMLEPVNFLILDEPTNHLDMHSKEILKTALCHFNGTILVVSHDREFLDNLVNCVYEFRNKKIKQHLGGIYDFLRKKKMESLKELEAAENNRSTKKNNRPLKEKIPVFEEKKEINKNISRSEKRILQLENKIESLETELSNMDEQLATPENIDNPAIFNDYNELKSRLESALEQWENEHNDLEDWKSKKNW